MSYSAIWIMLSMTLCTATVPPITEAPDLPDEFEEEAKTQTKVPDSELRMSMEILYQS